MILSKKTILIFFLAGLFYCGGGAYRALAQKSAEALSQPTITINPDIYYPVDELLYLEGRAFPESVIQIQFQKSGAKPINLNVKSDANGEWVLAEKVPLEAGNWEIRARVVQSSGKTSEWSNPRVVKAIQTGFILGGFTVKYAFILFLLLVVITLGGTLLIYFFFRMRKFQANVQTLRVKELERALREKTKKLEGVIMAGEKKEAQTAVEKGFRELREAMEKELRHLDEVLGDRAPTKEEMEHRERLLQELKNVEEKIESKISTIDKAVG